MVDPYIVRNTRGEIIATIETGTRNRTATSLVLHGRGAPEYGLDENQNLVYLLENFSNTEPPENPIEGQLWWKTGDQLFVWKVEGSPRIGSWASVVPDASALGFDVRAGRGLVGGGFPTTSPLATFLDVGAGTGITLAADSVSVDPSGVIHDNLSGFVANEHTDHSLVTVTAGAGLFIGSPLAFPSPDDDRDLTQSFRINVGGSTGIRVESNSVFADSTVFTIAGSPTDQTITGILTFQDQVRQPTGGGPSAPPYTFASDTDTGWYRSAANQLTFVTAGADRITIESDGTMSADTIAYETLVTEDDDIPNKLYVDNNIVAGTSPTENFFVGGSSITGLTIGKKYLITVYGPITRFGGTGNRTLDQIKIRAGTVLGSGTVLVGSQLKSINWPDGEAPTFIQHIISSISTSSIHGQIHDASVRGYGVDTFATYMTAVQLD